MEEGGYGARPAVPNHTWPELCGPPQSRAQVAGGLAGFVLVGLANVSSFGLELALLRNVYDANPPLAAPKPKPAEGVAKSSLQCGDCCGSLRTFLRPPKSSRGAELARVSVRGEGR